MPRSLDETLTRSIELTRAGRHKEHLALIREALLLYPGELEVVIRAAGAQVVEAPEEAARLASEAVNLAPEDPATLTRAASVMFSVEQLEEARHLFSRATRTADDDFVLAFDLAYLGAQLAFAYGDDEKAEELCSPSRSRISRRALATALLSPGCSIVGASRSVRSRSSRRRCAIGRETSSSKSCACAFAGPWPVREGFPGMVVTRDRRDERRS